MSSEWIYRHFGIVSDAERAAGNTAAAEIDPDTGGADTFSTPLSADGSAATDWGFDSAATEAMRQAMLGALPNLSSIRYWRCGAATGVLQATNVAASLAKVGQAFGWDDALADAGLQVVAPDGGGL